MTRALRSIEMLFCRIDIGPDWISTHFADGTEYGAVPHETPEYRALALRCGYSMPATAGQIRMMKAFVAIAENVGIIKPRQEGTTVCPNCADVLHYFRGKNRVWIICKTPDCVHVEVEPDPKKPWPGIERMEAKGNA